MKNPTCVCVLLLALPFALHAADATWTGNNGAGAGSNQWSFADNWAGGTGVSDDDNLTFAGSSKLTNTNDILAAVGSITFLSGGFTLDGDAFGLSGGLTNQAGNNTVNIDMPLTASQAFDVPSGTLSLRGGVNLSGYTLDLGGTGTVQMTGNLAGWGELNKVGPGTLSLGSQNVAMSGTIRVRSGVVIAATNDALGSGAVLVEGGRLQINNTLFNTSAGVVTLSSNAAIVANYPLDQTLVSSISGASPAGIVLMNTGSATNLDFAGPGLANVFLGATGNHTLSGTITPAASAYRLGGGNVNYYFTGNTGLTVTNLSGANDVVVGQPGLVTLIAGNTYSGRTIVTNRGAVRIDGDFLGDVPVALVGDNLIFDNGVLRFGPVTINLPATRGIHLAPGGVEFHPWSSANVTFNAPLTGPGGWTRTDSGLTTFTATNTFAGPVSNVVGGTVNFAGYGSLGQPSGVWQAGGTMNVSNENPSFAGMATVTNSTLALAFSNAIGTGSVTLLNAGTLLLQAPGAINGGTVSAARGGLVQVNAASNLPAAGAVLVENGGRFFANFAEAGQDTLDLLNTNSAGAFVISGATSSNFDFSAHAGLSFGASGNIVYGGTITPAGGDYLVGGGNNSPAVSANTFLTLTNLTGARNVVIGQPGTVTLDTGNDFTGNIVVSNGGWLVVRNDTFAPQPGSLVPDYLTMNDGKVRTYNGATGFSTNRGVFLAGGTNEFHVWSGNTFWIQGPVSGPGAMLTTDGGILKLTAGNTFAGGVLLSVGTIYVDDDSGLGAAGSPVTFMGNGAGVIRTTNTFSLGSRPVAVNSTGAFNVDAGSTLTVPASIGGAGGLTKQGAGALLLPSANTYSGNTTVAYGLVQIGHSNTIPGGTGRGNLQVDYYGTLDLNGRSASVNGLNGFGILTNETATPVSMTVGGNNAGGAFGGLSSMDVLTKTGTGNQTLFGPQSITGRVDVLQGTLTLDNASVPAPVTLNTGATLSLTTSATGLRGEYFNVAPLNVGNRCPDFTNLATLTTHLADKRLALVSYSSARGTNEFNFATNGSGFPAPYNAGGANFEVRWSGKYLAPTNGVYTFTTGSDDGSMLFIDGTNVVDNNYFQGVTYRSGAIELEAGPHDITIAFYQGGGGYGFLVSNAIPGGAATILPNSLLQSGSDTSIGSLAGIGGTLAVGGALNRLTVDQTGDGQFGGNLTGSAGAVLVKTGPGALVCYGNNGGYAGSLTILDGTLQLGNGVGGNGNIAGAGAITNNGLLVYHLTNATPTIANVIAGSGVTVMQGGNELILGGTNSFVGSWVISNGGIRVTDDFNFGAPPATLAATNIVFDGGGLKNNSSAPVLHANRGIWLGSNGVFFTAGWGGANPLTVNGPISGVGPLHVNVDGSPIVLANSANDYAGGTTIGTNGPGVYAPGSAAWLKLGADEVIPDGAGKGDVTINAFFKGRLDLNGHRETINGLDGDGTVNNSAAGAAELLVGGGDSDALFAGVIQDAPGSIALTKIGGGRQELTGTNTYSGPTTVSNGTLAIEGLHTGAGAIAVLPGATLSGTGTVNGALAVNGTLSPGNSPGTFYANSSVTFGPASLFEVEVNAGGAGADALQLNGGTLSIQNGARLSLTGAPVAAATYRILDNASAVGGTFRDPSGALILGTGTELGAIFGAAWTGWYIHNHLGFTELSQSPAGVTLSSFTATAAGGRGALQWITAGEVNNTGFHLERLDSNGNWVRISPALIASLGAGGGTYDFTDTTAVPGKKYLYRLIAVMGDGSNVIYGMFERVIMQDLRFRLFGEQPGSVFQFVWTSREGETYRLSRSANLLDTNLWTTVTNGIPAVPPTNSWTIPVTGSGAAFRIEVE